MMDLYKRDFSEFDINNSGYINMGIEFQQFLGKQVSRDPICSVTKQ